MKLNCELSVLQKPKDFFSQILSSLSKGHNKRLRGQTIDKTVTIPNRTGRNPLFETGHCSNGCRGAKKFFDLSGGDSKRFCDL